MYERTHNINNNQYNSKNKINKAYYCCNKSSLLNYNKNLNCIKGNKSIYTLLKDKMKSKNLNNESNMKYSKAFIYKNLTSNNSHRNNSFLKDNNKKKTNSRIFSNKINKTIWAEKAHNKSNENIFFIYNMSGFYTNKNSRERMDNLSKGNNFKNCNHLQNYLNINKRNKIDIIIDNLKNKIGVNTQYKFYKNIGNNQNLFYENKNNKINNKSFNNSFSLNNSKKTTNLNFNLSNYNIKNNININSYLSTINSNNFDKNMENKKYNNNYTINDNNLINKSFSNKNYLYNNKKKENDFFKNKQSNNINKYNNEKNKNQNFLFTQNNINNFYILNSFDYKEDFYKNKINNKKYHNSTTNICIKKNKKNNLFFDLLQNEAKLGEEYSKNFTINLNKNLKTKRNNSIFGYKNKIDIFNGYKNDNKEKEFNKFINNSKKIINEDNKQQYNDDANSNFHLFNFNNNNEDSIDINNIDDSSILLDN